MLLLGAVACDPAWCAYAGRENPFSGMPVPPGYELAASARTAFAHGVGQGDQVVLIGVGGQRAGVAHQLPSAGRGDPAGVADAQIPRMRFAHGREWAYDCRRVRVDERQGRHGVMRAPGPAAATGNVHVERLSCGNAAEAPDTRNRRAHDVQPLPSARGRFAQLPARWLAGRPVRGRSTPHRATRRGRDMRGPLLPPTVPGWRSRAERFDMAVLEAYEPIERRWQ